MPPYPTKYLAQVGHHLVPDWLNVGWMVVADLGSTHGEWSVLMSWVCPSCPVVKPLGGNIMSIANPSDDRPIEARGHLSPESEKPKPMKQESLL